MSLLTPLYNHGVVAVLLLLLLLLLLFNVLIVLNKRDALETNYGTTLVGHHDAECSPSSCVSESVPPQNPRLSFWIFLVSVPPYGWVHGSPNPKAAGTLRV